MYRSIFQESNTEEALVSRTVGLSIMVPLSVNVKKKCDKKTISTRTAGLITRTFEQSTVLNKKVIQRKQWLGGQSG